MSKNLLSIFIGCLVVSFYALNNKFPLLLEGSGLYIASGFSREVPVSFNFVYAIFVAHSSWGLSLWLVILTQSLFVSLIVYYYFHFFLSSNKRRLIYYISFLFFVSFLTTGSVIVSTISPVVFLSVSICATGLLLFVETMNTRDRIIIIIIGALSASMDVAYILSLIAVTIIYFVKSIIKKKKGEIISANPLISLSIVILSSIGLFLLAYSNLDNDRNANYYLYIFPRIANSGLAKKYIKEQCEIKQTSICNYINIPSRYVANGGSMTRIKLSSSERKLLTDLTKSVVGSENFYPEYFGVLVSDFYNVTTDLKTKKYRRSQQNEETTTAIENWFPHEIRQNYLSKQQEGLAKFKLLNIAQWIVAISLGILYLVLIFRYHTRYTMLISYLIIVFFINMTTSTLVYGTGNDFPSGSLWILSLPVFLLLSRLEIKAKLNEKNY